MSSSRRSSGGKRGHRGQRQPGIVESFTRVKPSCVAVDDNQPTVIDLDSDDPYKFVDSQSLLPDDDIPDIGPITTPVARWASVTSHTKKTRSDDNTDDVFTPKRIRTPGGSATGSTKQKQTPKSKIASTEDDWCQEEIELALTASRQEKQREDRRKRLKMRVTRVEEEDQIRLLTECESGMVWRDDSDKEEDSDFKEKSEQVNQANGELGLTCDRDVSMHQTFDSITEVPFSAVSAVGLASGTLLALKSVSVKKLSKKSLQTKKDDKSETVVGESAGGTDEMMIIDEEPTGQSATESDDHYGKKKSTLCESEVTVDVLMHHGGNEGAPTDYDRDETPPISEHKSATMDSYKVHAITDKPLCRTSGTGVHSKEVLLSDGESIGKGETPPVRSRKARSTKVVLSLRKSRKRLSDPENSSFQEVHSSSAQGPLAKRPKIQENHNQDAPIIMKSSTAKSSAPGTRQFPNGGEEAGVTKEKTVKLAKISLTDIKKTQDIISKRAETAKNQRNNTTVNLHKEDTEHDEKDKVSDKTKEKDNSFSLMENGLDTENKSLLRGTMENHQVNQHVARNAKATLSNGVPSGTSNGWLVKRKASGWPLVKVRPSERPRVPSLQAPPGVPPAEHTQVLIRCFNEYFTKLAMAQCNVLWRMKWGQPVSNINKMASSSLSAGRRTKRSRNVNIPYSEYALDLKSAPSVSKDRSLSPPVAVLERSPTKQSPSKSPCSSSREILSRSDSDSDFLPPKSTEKQKRQRHQQCASSGRRKLNFRKETKGGAHRTPSKSPHGAVSGRLSLSKKKSPQQREKPSMSSRSPSLQLEREESPDIVPLCKPSEKRSEVNFAAVSSRSASPTAPSIRDSATPQFQDDDVMTLDLTSPSPPPGGQRRSSGAGNENESSTNFSDGNEDKFHFHNNVGSHSPIDHDTDDSANEEGRPLRGDASSVTSRLFLHRDTESLSDDNEQGHPRPTTATASSSSTWLNARNPPPQQPKTKRPTKQTKSNIQSKRKTAGVESGAKEGKRSTKKPTSASMRIKALIQMSDSDTEYCSQDDSRSATRYKGALSKPPLKTKTSDEQLLESSDSDSSEMEFDGPEERRGSPMPASLSKSNSPTNSSMEHDRRKRLDFDSHTRESIIDLTADSQMPPDHTSHSVPSSRSNSPGDGCVSCPMCGERFDSSVIQLHAEQCEGPESDRDSRWSEDITRYTVASSVKSKPADNNKKRGSLSKQRWGARGRKSYQPSLVQLVNKEKEITGEDAIDSDTTADEHGDDPNVNFDDFKAADSADFDAHLDWTVKEGSGKSGRCHGAQALPEDGEGGYFREPSVDSDAQPEAVPIEDGEGGYIIDPSMISSSPIRSFKKLSDLDPQERAGFDNQFKSKRSRGGRNNQRGRQPMTVEQRSSATWDRNDFGDLFDSDERTKGQRGRGRGRGRGGSRRSRPFKYDWKKARGRGRGASRGRRS